MRVLLFGPPTVHLLRWRELAEQAGVATDLISYDHRHPDAVAHFDALPDGRVARLWGLLVAARRFRRIVRKRGPDAVHAHWLIGPAWIAALAGGPQLVVTAWGSDALRWTPASALARLLARVVARRAGALTYDAESVRAVLAAAGARDEQLVRIVIGADDERFGPRPVDRDLLDRLGAPAARPVVLSARGLDPVYRPDVVLEAFAVLAADRAATLLVRAGERDQRLDSFLRRAGDLGIASSVVVYHGVTDDELPSLLASVDAAISVPESDGTSVLLLECLLCETPVVVSDIAANREWVPADDGWLVPVGDAPTLARTLARILDDLPRARELAAAGAARVRTDGTRRRQRQLIGELYERVIAAASTAPARA